MLTIPIPRAPKAARARLNELLEEQEQQGGKSSAPSGHQLAQWKRHLKSPKTTGEEDAAFIAKGDH